ncbi:hypothetical protein DOT_1266 [Desulfosporosinus sp. OT]|nr:hypothetical protein DOT_1266 [Desulfosporosinus sp. OT]
MTECWLKVSRYTVARYPAQFVHFSIKKTWLPCEATVFVRVNLRRSLGEGDFPSCTYASESMQRKVILSELAQKTGRLPYGNLPETLVYS